MRHVVSIFFFLLIALQAVHLPVLSFWLNVQQDFIAANLCENRLKPELMCGGRCYISKHTSEAIGQQEHHGDAPVSTLDWSRSLSPFIFSKPLLPEFTIDLISPSVYYKAPTYAFLYAKAIFHPPC